MNFFIRFQNEIRGKVTGNIFEIIYEQLLTSLRLDE